LKATVAVSIVNRLLTCNVIVLIPTVPTSKSVKTGIGTFLNMLLSSDALFHYYGNSYHSHVFPSLRMQFKDGTCDWEDVEDQFIIGRSGLTHKIPVKNNGDIDCKALDGERRFPRLDYSKGYSDWWFLSQTDISVPSEHVQHGKRYDAEVVLSHFYEFDHPWNMVGKVAIFLDAYENEAPWHFLDKLICQWRRVEEKSRSNCNLPPAPVYKMCELYRGQTRSAEDFESPTEQVTYPTYTPLVAPKAIPIVNYGGEPPLEKIPLKLCEGDCDFPTDCAKGLICHRRDAYEAIPGCIGG
jgi:hypothetical protein